ncbi:MAG: hypothetical protein K0R00_3985 [Herbinix sp.]|jgi:stage III sporulation protein AB|nr:hypothetical protein [Herbinix sp.]
MGIMKIIGCIMVILSSAGMGFYLSNEMRCRIADLKELKKIIGLLKGDIRYGNTPLPEAIHAIQRRHEGNYKVFLKQVSTKLNELSGQTFTEIWKAETETGLADTSLSKKDKLQLSAFGENLGYLDKEMQMNTFELYLSQLDETILDLSKTVKEKTYMFNTLGIMAGIFITIIMV